MHVTHTHICTYIHAYLHDCRIGDRNRTSCASTKERTGGCTSETDQNVCISSSPTHIQCVRPPRLYTRKCAHVCICVCARACVRATRLHDHDVQSALAQIYFICLAHTYIGPRTRLLVLQNDLLDVPSYVVLMMPTCTIYFCFRIPRRVLLHQSYMHTQILVMKTNAYIYIYIYIYPCSCLG